MILRHFGSKLKNPDQTSQANSREETHRDRDRSRASQRERERQRDREPESQRDREPESQRDRETDRQTDRQTERERETDRQTVFSCSAAFFPKQRLRLRVLYIVSLNNVYV